jgi:hypothetical protein
MGANFVLAGRCSDSALFAAIPLMQGFPPGLAWHAGKVSECGTLVCQTLGKGVIFSTIGQDDHHSPVWRRPSMHAAERRCAQPV